MTRDSYREKGRAVFFAAIMVLSVVAMSVTFAGSAAAAPENVSLDTFNPDDSEVVQGENVDTDIEVSSDNVITNAGTVQFDVTLAEGTFDSAPADADVVISDGDNQVDGTAGAVSISRTQDDTAQDTLEVVYDTQATGAELTGATDASLTLTVDPASVTHSASADDYDVDVTVTDDDGSDSTTGSSGLTVQDTYDLELASTNLPDQVDTGDTIETGDIDAEIENNGPTEATVGSVSVDIFDASEDDTTQNSLPVDQSGTWGDYTDGGGATATAPSLDTTETVEFGVATNNGGDVTLEHEITVGASGGDSEGTSDDELNYVNSNDDDVSVIFQGQDAYAVGDLIGDESYDLRSVDSFDSGVVDSSSFEEELNAEEIDDEDHPLDGQTVVKIETDNLEDNDYFLQGGDLPANPAQGDTFEVTVQDFDASFDDDSVTDAGPDSTTDLEVDSSRSDYSTNVSASGDLSDAELFSIFVDAGADREGFLGGPNVNGNTIQHVIDADNDINSVQAFAEEVRANADPADLHSDGDLSGETFGSFDVGLYQQGEDGEDTDHDEKVVLVNKGDLDEEEVDFTDIDEDDYTFDFNVTDTEASASGDISVAESDATADFDQSVYSQTAGDIINTTVELDDTDDAYVQVGGADAGFLDILYIEDDDDDDEVQFQVNTRLVGSDEGVYTSDDDVVASITQDPDNDAFDNENIGFWDEEVGDTITDDGGDFEWYLQNLDLVSEGEGPETQLTRPLQPTDYTFATNDGNFIINGDDEIELDDEYDAATIDLTEPELGDITTSVAPGEAADEHTLAELLGDEEDAATLTERTDIAEDDRLVIQAEASGLYGAMVDIEGDIDALDEGFSSDTIATLNDGAGDYEGEGITIEVEEDDATGNQDPNKLDFANANDDEIFVYTDNENGELYIVADTGASGAFDRSIEAGDDFTASIEYETDDDERYEFGGNSDEPFAGGAGGAEDPAYPYFGADETQSVSTEFTIAEPTGAFDYVEDDLVTIEPGNESVVSGETNVAPGSNADVRVQQRGDTASFLQTESVSIDGDGNFETEFNFDDREEDDQAVANFRVEGTEVVDQDGIFGEVDMEQASFDVSVDAPSAVQPGEEFDADVTVTNTGDESGTAELTIEVDGNVEHDEEYELDGGDSEDVTLTATAGDDGDSHEITVDTQNASDSATIDVDEDADPVDDGADDSADDGSADDSANDSADDSADDDQPGFGIAVALFALISAALLAARRRD